MDCSTSFLAIAMLAREPDKRTTTKPVLEVETWMVVQVLDMIDLIRSNWDLEPRDDFWMTWSEGISSLSVEV